MARQKGSEMIKRLAWFCYSDLHQSCLTPARPVPAQPVPFTPHHPTRQSVRNLANGRWFLNGRFLIANFPFRFHLTKNVARMGIER